MKESIVLLVLGASWAGYLGWFWRENRKTSHRRSDGIRAFSSGLGSLGGSASRSYGFGSSVPALAPRTASDAARRRREVLVILAVAAVLTLFAAIGVGGVAVLVHVVVDIALAAYGYALVQRRNDEAEREIKVHMLYPERAGGARPRPRQVVNG
jgi:hypothetical protein